MKLAHKIDSEVLVSVTTTLQDSEATMRTLILDKYEQIKSENPGKKKKAKDKIIKSMNHPSFVQIMKKRLSIVYACVEICSTVSFIDEIEEGISLRCLYQILA